MGASGMDMPVGMQALSSVGATGMGVWGSDYHYAAWAALAQAQYSYKERYVATASIRYEWEVFLPQMTLSK